MYEFVRNTHNMLAQLDASAYRGSDPAAQAQMKEITGRNTFAKMLLKDTRNWALLRGVGRWILGTR